MVNGKRISAGRTAGDYAKETGRQTLPMVLKEQKIKLPKFDIENQSSIDLWRLASMIFAACASGVVHAFLGEEVKETSIYVNDEKPILMETPDVTKLIERDRPGQPPEVVK
ncbi:hypothetical protein BKA70DRAFT_1129823 [Coprinopsis sp. MPI-PUGE-AT-0042]|nr:hypothetical protein BKA70DRAFT_1129823 [Coprinopsis sp. MPI-PUGE-AT-0042]